MSLNDSHFHVGIATRLQFRNGTFDSPFETPRKKSKLVTVKQFLQWNTIILLWLLSWQNLKIEMEFAYAKTAKRVTKGVCNQTGHKNIC